MNAARAHAAVSTAIYNGTLIRQPCEVCGKDQTDAHHDDYAKPLDVRWLCRSHHRLHHSKGVTPVITLRTDLTKDEYREIRKLALDRREHVSTVCGDALRTLLKGGKP